MDSDTLIDAGTPDGYRFSTNFLVSVITSGVFLISAVAFFLLAWPQYTSEQYIDYKLKLLKPEDTKWLLLMFLIPLVVQLLCFCVFFFFGARKKKSLLLFYGVCLTVMFFSSAGYCFLFKIYTDVNNYERGLNYSEWYSIFALCLVCVLLLAVGLITYAIIWSPAAENPHEDWRLEERDIEWPAFLACLRDSTSYNVTNGQPVNGFLRKVYESLGTASRREIAAAQENGGTINEETQAALCRDLNAVLKRRDLYLAVDVRQIDRDGREAREAFVLLRRTQETLSEEEMRRLNRLLFKSFCGPAIRKAVPPPGWFGRHLMSFRRKWESLLSRLKEGIVELHFWVLVFFFTVFLSINYLLGFAFAFHDKATEKKDGYPAMVLTKARPSTTGVPSLLGDGAGRQGGVPPDRGEANPTTKVNYAFYFDSKSAVPRFRDEDFVEGNFAVTTKEGLDRRSKSWREIKNYRHLAEAAAAIDALTKSGEWLRVELIGSADGDQLKEDTTYTSNYALSEARAQNVKYMLMKKLAEHGNQQRNVEWLSLPLSNENTPRRLLSREEAKQSEELSKATKASTSRGRRLTPRELEAAEVDGEYNARVNRVWNSEPAFESHEGRDLESKVAAVYNAVRDKGLAAEHRRELYDKVKDLADILRSIKKDKNDKAADGERLKRLQELQKVKGDELTSALEALKYLDEDDAKRVAIVSLTPVQSNHQYLPLSLMDYMYFTTYTVTTTGYGDITPTTTYTKFLCSFANIIEVFFLVVFFNALLSVKGDSKPAQLSGVA